MNILTSLYFLIVTSLYRDDSIFLGLWNVSFRRLAFFLRCFLVVLWRLLHFLNNLFILIGFHLEILTSHFLVFKSCFDQVCLDIHGSGLRVFIELFWCLCLRCSQGRNLFYFRLVSLWTCFGLYCFWVTLNVSSSFAHFFNGHYRYLPLRSTLGSSWKLDNWYQAISTFWFAHQELYVLFYPELSCSFFPSLSP